MMAVNKHWPRIQKLTKAGGTKKQSDWTDG